MGKKEKLSKRLRALTISPNLSIHKENFVIYQTKLSGQITQWNFYKNYGKFSKKSLPIYAVPTNGRRIYITQVLKVAS